MGLQSISIGMSVRPRRLQNLTLSPVIVPSSDRAFPASLGFTIILSRYFPILFIFPAIPPQAHYDRSHLIHAGARSLDVTCSRYYHLARKTEDAHPPRTTNLCRLHRPEIEWEDGVTESLARGRRVNRALLRCGVEQWDCLLRKTIYRDVNSSIRTTVF